MSFIQSTTGATSGTSVTTAAFGTQPVAGNMIVVAVGQSANSFSNNTSVTDSAGNTYSVDVNVGGGPSIKLWRAFNISTTPSFTVTANFTSTDSVAIIAQEFNAIILTNPSDVQTSATNTGTTANSGTTVSLAQSDELVVGATTVSTASTTISLGSGYSNLATTVSGASLGIGMESKIVGSTSGVSATFGLSSSATYDCVVATYKMNVSSTAVLVQPPTVYYPANNRPQYMYESYFSPFGTLFNKVVVTTGIDYPGFSYGYKDSYIGY